MSKQNFVKLPVDGTPVPLVTHTPQSCPWAKMVAIMLTWCGGEAEVTDLELYKVERAYLYAVPSTGAAKMTIGVRYPKDKPGE